MYFEGYAMQLVDVILSSLHAPLKYKYIDIYKADEVLKNNIFDVLRKYKIVIEVENSESAIRTSLQDPDVKKVDSLRGKLKYYVNQIIKDYETEKKDYLDGRKPLGVSPYAFLDSEKITSGKTVEELIEGHDKRFNEWAKMAKTQNFKAAHDICICDYPYLGFYGEAKLKKFYEIDLEYNIIKVVQKNNLKHFYEYKPRASSEIGLYYENGRRSKERSYDIQLPEVGEAVPTFMENLSDMKPGEFYIDRVLDVRSSRLVNIITTSCHDNYFFSMMQNQNGRGVMETAGKLKELIPFIYPGIKKPSATHYAALKEYLHALRRVGITYKTVKKLEDGEEQTVISTISLFDSVEISEDKSGNTDMIYYRVELGQTFAKDLINARVSTIIRPTIDSLQVEIAKLLYQDLKPHRLYDVMEMGNQETDHFYSIERLQLMARVPGSKAVKIKKYTAAIEELKQKEILVKDYKLIKGATVGFMITWLPLSKTEYSDVLYYDPNQSNWVAASL